MADPLCTPCGPAGRYAENLFRRLIEQVSLNSSSLAENAMIIDKAMRGVRMANYLTELT